MITQLIGVNLEYGPNREKNNTLITADSIVYEESKRELVCSTDREDCCVDEFNIPGNWFLPNGSKISSTTNTQSLHITLGNQNMGLNITNSHEVPIGIYHCEMMDRENVTHYLYAGIYPEDKGMHVLRTLSKSLYGYIVMSTNNIIQEIF